MAKPPPFVAVKTASGPKGKAVAVKTGGKPPPFVKGGGKAPAGGKKPNPFAK